jgi:hypothetical protein
LALLAGAAVVIACLVPWVTASKAAFIGDSALARSYAGTQTLYGLIALVAGIFIAALGLFLLLGAIRGVVTAFLILSAVVTGGVAGFAVSDPQAVFVDAVSRELASPEMPKDRIETVVQGLVDAAGLEVAAGWGVYMAMGGAVAALLAGLLALRKRRSRGATASRATQNTVEPVPPAAEPPPSVQESESPTVEAQAGPVDVGTATATKPVLDSEVVQSGPESKEEPPSDDEAMWRI